MTAAVNRHLEIVCFLREAWADLFDCNNEGSTVLILAGTWKLCDPCAEMERALFDHTKNGSMALMLAASTGHFGSLRFLRDDAVVDLSDRHNRGWMAFMFAAGEENYLEIGRYLCDAGPDSCDYDGDGASPLYAAAHGGHAEIMRELISAGADVDYKSTRAGIGNINCDKSPLVSGSRRHGSGVAGGRVPAISH